LPSRPLNRHVWLMCRSRLWLLYWVRTTIFRYPALAKLDSAKSMIGSAHRTGPRAWPGPG